MAFRFRLATIADAPLIHQITTEAYAEYRDLAIPSTVFNETLQRVTDALQQPGTGAAVCLSPDVSADGLRHAEATDLDAAAAAVRFRRDDDGLYFFRLGVRPAWRGQGVARAMLRWLEAYAGNIGVERIWCQVRLDKPQNARLYERAGYEITGEKTVDRGGHKLILLTMSKPVACPPTSRAACPAPAADVS